MPKKNTKIFVRTYRSCFEYVIIFHILVVTIGENFECSYLNVLNWLVICTDVHLHFLTFIGRLSLVCVLFALIVNLRFIVFRLMILLLLKFVCTLRKAMCIFYHVNLCQCSRFPHAELINLQVIEKFLTFKVLTYCKLVSRRLAW